MPISLVGETALDVAARAGRVEAFAALSPHFSWLARLSARGVLSRSQKGSRLARATRLQRMDRIHDDARFGRLAAHDKAALDRIARPAAKSAAATSAATLAATLDDAGEHAIQPASPFAAGRAFAAALLAVEA